MDLNIILAWSWPIIGVLIAVLGAYFGAKTDDEQLFLTGVVGGILWPLVLFIGVITSPIWIACMLGARARDKSKERKTAFARRAFETAQAEWLAENPTAGRDRLPRRLQNFYERDWVKE